MKILNKAVKAIFFVFLVVDCFIFLFVHIIGQTVSDNYKINRGDALEINTIIPVTAEYNGARLSQSSLHNVGDTFEVDLKMFGVIPFATADVEVVDEMYVAVLGNPFGMKIYTDGVLVIEVSDVDSSSGAVNPAKDAGIRIGDYIASVNGRKIGCNEDLSELVLASGGSDMKFEVVREGQAFYCNIKPVMSLESGTYRIGLWVRDSSAGIGTLTFYSPLTGIVCGLGHGICDNDTGSLLTLDSGELVGARIVSVNKGSSGSPGELKGSFTYDTIADIVYNSESGVYGMLRGNIDISDLTEIALKQEIEDGKAQILCTVDGQTPKLYSCNIKKRIDSYHSNTQNLIVTITDSELINATGGIVQGMSGSPILQNGKLIGALTHVLVDDATSGYGIFAENMLENAQYAAQQGLKEAS